MNLIRILAVTRKFGCEHAIFLYCPDHQHNRDQGGRVLSRSQCHSDHEQNERRVHRMPHKTIWTALNDVLSAVALDPRVHRQEMIRSGAPPIDTSSDAKERAGIGPRPATPLTTIFTDSRDRRISAFIVDRPRRIHQDRILYDTLTTVIGKRLTPVLRIGCIAICLPLNCLFFRQIP